MRDANRLDEFYDTLKEIHKTQAPDWRFGQLFNNIQRASGNDLFYYEEDKILEVIKEFFGVEG